jgi:hypothetical protein
VIFLVMLLAFTIEFFFAIILSTSTIRQFAETYFKLLPPLIKQMTGFLGEGFVGSQFIAFGYTHPAILFMLTFMSVSIATRYISAEIEGRSIELLGLRLLPRYRIVLTPFFFTIVATALIYISMAAGSLAGREILDLQGDINLVVLFKIAGIGMLFFSAISAIVTLVATISAERGSALAWSIGIILSLFVIDAIIRLWPMIDFLKPYSFFNWYQPVEIATGRYDFQIGIPVLLILTPLLLILSVIVFNKRDL